MLCSILFLAGLCHAQSQQSFDTKVFEDWANISRWTCTGSFRGAVVRETSKTSWILAQSPRILDSGEGFGRATLEVDVPEGARYVHTELGSLNDGKSWLTVQNPDGKGGWLDIGSAASAHTSHLAMSNIAIGKGSHIRIALQTESGMLVGALSFVQSEVKLANQQVRSSVASVNNLLSQSFVAIDSRTQNAVESYANDVLQRLNLPGVWMAVGSGGHVIATYARGVSREGESRRAATVSQLIPYGSTSKQMTGTLAEIVAQYAPHQEFSLDSKLLDLVPELVKPMDSSTRGIALRELINHTSGLSNGPFSAKSQIHAWTA